MRLKLDENLPASLVPRLEEHGHDVTTVLQQELGGTPDEQLACVCTGEQRALVTLDRGFGDIRRYPPGTHAGIAVLRIVDQSIPSIERIGASLARLLADRDITGQIWIVGADRVRIRG